MKPSGYTCEHCGWEWRGAEPPNNPGPCDAHFGGVACPSVRQFAYHKRRWALEEAAKAAEQCDTQKSTGAPCSSCAGAAERIRALALLTA